MARSVICKTDPCLDWIYSDSSNVHIAKDRAWFTSNYPLPCHLTCIYAINPPIPVLGIGTIKLTVKATPGSFTTYGVSTIELHNVLHAPSYFFNVLVRPLGSICQTSLGGSSHEAGRASRGGLMLQGKQVAYFHPGTLCFFSLAVQPPSGINFGPRVVRTGVDWA
ncbi:hypothetical protein N0V91_004640 [Didymella pomorum]|uniref:Uncharacterized protein n=1 Tax=Didymella pomorum TaxID=749634 RepID=A0A9W9D943_9PLEO|nr:hypothetical protein N0V91_004640 [Didymella pomorum]